MKKKRKHQKEIRSLSEWREARNFVLYNKKIRKLIKAFREQERTLANHPF
jgi:hypothetical protein